MVDGVAAGDVHERRIGRGQLSVNDFELQELRAELTRVRKVFGRRSSQSSAAFTKLHRRSVELGQGIGDLPQFMADEKQRFFAHVRAGPDGHYFWDTQSAEFVGNDGRSRAAYRWWWEYENNAKLEKTDQLHPGCGARNCIAPKHYVSGRNARERVYTDNQAIGSLQVVAMRLGRSPFKQDWDRGKYSPSSTTLVSRFGGWEKVLRAAGLAPAKITVVTPARCIESLRYAHKLLGHWPTTTEFRDLRLKLGAQGLPTAPHTIRLRLGPWPKALYRAGKR